MKETLKSMRLEIDTQTNSTKLLTGSPETTLAWRSLQWAKMWLGKGLAELGEETPYPHSEDKKSPIIENQAEHTDNTFQKEWQNENIFGNNIACVKDLRHKIQKTINNIENMESSITELNNISKFELFMQQSYLELHKAKMILGMELNRILEEKKKNAQKS